MENNTDALTSGTRLSGSYGIFEIVEKLGQGGFGITYKAELLVNGKFGLTRSGAVVAVKEFFISDINSRRGTKVVGTESRKFSSTLRRFERESNLLSRLDHPGICHVQDAFAANGTAYYVMDYYGGGSLDALIRQAPGGALSERRAIGFIREIGAALSYLHGKRLAHLDLKPQNVMLKQDGSLVLIDFGISKMYGEDGQFQTNDTMGGCTPGYAPLEQTNYSEKSGDPHLMDIYALGATLYRMLTGQRPPTASDVNNYGLPIDPLNRRRVSEQTISVIIKAMRPRKIDRFQSVEEMMRELGETEQMDEEVEVLSVESEKTSDIRFENDEIPQYGHKIPQCYELCTVLNGKVIYFSQEEWNNVPSNLKNNFKKKGLYIAFMGYEPFLLHLHHSEYISWDDAMAKYSKKLPTKELGEIIALNFEKINSCIKAFGGDKNTEELYWTCTSEETEGAFYFSMKSGFLSTFRKDGYSIIRVRAISRVPYSK